MRTFLRIIIPLALVAALTACGSSQPSSDSSGRGLRISWALAADTVEGLEKNSDAVAEVTVTSIVGAGQDAGVPFTLFSAKASRWLHGSGPGAITIRQSGDRSMQVEDDPLLVVGEHAVVFLREYETGRYLIVGGPTGRFDIDAKGDLTPLPGGVVESPPGTLASMATRLGSDQSSQ